MPSVPGTPGVGVNVRQPPRACPPPPLRSRKVAQPEAVVDATIVGAGGNADAVGTAATFLVVELGSGGSATAAGSGAALNVVEVAASGAATAAGGSGLLNMVIVGGQGAATGEGTSGSITAVDGAADAAIIGSSGDATASGGSGSISGVDAPVVPPEDEDLGDQSSIYGELAVNARIVGRSAVAWASGSRARIHGESPLRVRLPSRRRDGRMVGRSGWATADGGRAAFNVAWVADTGQAWATAGVGAVAVSDEQDPLENEDAAVLLMLGVL